VVSVWRSLLSGLREMAHTRPSAGGWRLERRSGDAAVALILGILAWMRGGGKRKRGAGGIERACAAWAGFCQEKWRLSRFILSRFIRSVLRLRTIEISDVPFSASENRWLSHFIPAVSSQLSARKIYHHGGTEARRGLENEKREMKRKIERGSVGAGVRRWRN
jgi:hypothetical protein